MIAPTRLLALALAVGPLACSRRAPPAGGLPTPASTSTVTSTVTFCGALDCAQYDSPTEAFLRALRSPAGEPLVIAVGEAHAPRGATVPSAATRFAGDILPLLAGRSTDLLVELMMPPASCLDAAAEARKGEAPIADRQAPTDQNEYVAMGQRARALGIVPDLLRPTCADIDALARAGAGTADELVDVSLTTIARLTRAQGGKLLELAQARAAGEDPGAGRAIVIYGGSLHDKLDPAPEAARWSYAPELDAKAGGRFVAVDLIVPEFIGDDAVWRSLPWWPHYDRARLGGRTTLFRTGTKSFVLVFPVTAAGVKTGAATGGDR